MCARAIDQALHRLQSGCCPNVRTVQQHHRNLGHPSAEALTELLESREASEAILEAARKHQCVACLRYKKPNQVAPASIKQVTEFGEKILADVFWVKPGNVTYPVLSSVDSATKYQTAAVIHMLRRATTTSLPLSGAGSDTLGFHRYWPLMRNEVGLEMTSTHGPRPTASCMKLTLVKLTRNWLLWSADIRSSERPLKSVTGTNGIRQALCYLLPQINATPSVGGFSPSQWLLGKQIRLPGDLALDRMTPAQLDGHDDFEMTLKRRNAAKQALLQAETDRKLRRAMLRKYQGTNLPLEVGQLCFFWRDAKAADLVKIRWHGPARVVAREDKDRNPDVYWFAWKTQLLRCSPHHVRSDYTSANTQVADAKLAVKDVQALKSRGMTRYLDLNRVNR